LIFMMTALLERFGDMLKRSAPSARRTAVCGHRGAPLHAPENTLPAFREAVKAGAECVELDVYLTKDEEVVVVHDPRLGRTTDKGGYVRDLTLSQIHAADAGAWFSDAFAGERVPTLRQVLDCLRGRAIPLVEIKEKASRPNLVPRLAATVREAGDERNIVFIGRDEKLALALKAELPQALHSMIAFTKRRARRIAAAGLDGIVPYYRTATARMIAEAHDRGLFCVPWTVNRLKHMKYFIDAGADAVITDFPHVLRSLIGADGGNGNGNAPPIPLPAPVPESVPVPVPEPVTPCPLVGATGQGSRVGG
jgi:glycerophosphoryl diester phosphodiesterase